MRISLQASHDEKSYSFARHISKWMDQVMGPGFHTYCPEESWSPAINLYETEAEYYVVADLAGVQVDQIDLRVENGQMTLRGGRPTPVPPAGAGTARLHLMEIDHGRFSRSLHLPQDVQVDAIEARYGGGFLWIRMPKRSPNP